MTGLKVESAFKIFQGCKTFMSLGPILRKENNFISGEEFDKVASSHHREPEWKNEEKPKKDKGREGDHGWDERKQ